MVPPEPDEDDGEGDCDTTAPWDGSIATSALWWLG